MSLKACSECGKTVSTNAESCPHCGANFHTTAKRKYAVGCVLAILCFLAFGWCFWPK